MTSIIGIGTSVPGIPLTRKAALAGAKTFTGGSVKEKRVLDVLYRRSMISSRHSVLKDDQDPESFLSFFLPPSGVDDKGPSTETRMKRYAEAAPALALEACRAAVSDARENVHSINNLVTVSCTGFSAPGFDIDLVRSLGLNPDISRSHIGFMGCHGALNGLRVASAFSQAQRDATTLLCAVELCSLHFQYGADSDDALANCLFADGAAAAILNGCATGSKWNVVANRSRILPDCDDFITWKIGDHGFSMTLSSLVPALIKEHLAPWLSRWLADFELSIADVASWAVHPGGARILDAVQESLQLSDDQMDPSRSILARYGNMSSPSVLFALQSLPAVSSSSPCVMLAFGPGVTIEACLLRMQ